MKVAKVLQDAHLGEGVGQRGVGGLEFEAMVPLDRYRSSKNLQRVVDGNSACHLVDAS